MLGRGRVGGEHPENGRRAVVEWTPALSHHHPPTARPICRPHPVSGSRLKRPAGTPPAWRCPAAPPHPFPLFSTPRTIIPHHPPRHVSAGRARPPHLPPSLLPVTRPTHQPPHPPCPLCVTADGTREGAEREERESGGGRSSSPPAAAGPRSTGQEGARGGRGGPRVRTTTRGRGRLRRGKARDKGKHMCGMEVPETAMVYSYRQSVQKVREGCHEAC